MPRLVYAALILLSLLWGGSFYFIKVLLHDFGPWSIAFLRSFSGLVTVSILMLAFRIPFGLRSIPWVGMTIMATVNTALPWALIGMGETRLTSSLASILNATTPLWTIIVGLLFFRKKTSRMQWIGIAIASVGLVELLGIRPGSAIQVDMLGFICMVAASFCYAMGSQLSKRLLSGHSMFQLTFGTLLCCSVVSGLVALFAEPGSPGVGLYLANLPYVIGLGVFGTGAGYILFYYIIREGSPEFATMVTYLVPCTALIWGAVLLDEAITWSLLIGLGIILGGVFLAGRKPKNGGV